MKQTSPEFAPLDPKRAEELKSVINQAAQTNEAVVIDPDAGVVGSKPADMISPKEKLGGMLRFKRHYLN